MLDAKLNTLKAIHDPTFPDLAKESIPRPARYLYAIGCFDGPKLLAIKLGSTRYLEERLSNVKVGSIHPIKLLAFHEGTKADEDRLHVRFRKERIQGEWYYPSDAILQEFGLVSKPGKGGA
jgi:hypothetical protein